MRHKKAITADTKKRYVKATKKEKTIILNQFTAITKYNRCSAARILRLAEGKVIGYSRIGGKRIKFVIGKNKRIKRKTARIYGKDVFLALKRIWVVFDFICGRRLAPFMAEAVKKLEYHKEIELSPTVRKKLLKISASTIDRLLKPEKDRYKLGNGKKRYKTGNTTKGSYSH